MLEPGAVPASGVQIVRLAERIQPDEVGQIES